MDDGAGIPAVTADQMAAVDRIMRDDFGVEPIQLMEVAGRAVAAFARARFLDGDAAGKRVAVLCGTGGNGGDGLVAARYLHAWGAGVTVFLGGAPREVSLAAHHLASLQRLALPVHGPDKEPALPDADLLIDALLGFSLAGPPAGASATLIRVANAAPTPVLAVDLPSGLDSTTGRVHEPCVRATATLTLALPKSGLLAASADAVTGDRWLADIGIPAKAFQRVGIETGLLFARDEFRRFDRTKNHQDSSPAPISRDEVAE